MTRSFDALPPAVRVHVVRRKLSDEVGPSFRQEEPKRFRFAKVEQVSVADLEPAGLAGRDEQMGPGEHHKSTLAYSAAFIAGTIGAMCQGDKGTDAHFYRASNSYLESSRLGADYPAAPSGRKI